jgi:tetratricopeptide (TPR) repeat protein
LGLAHAKGEEGAAGLTEVSINISGFAFQHLHDICQGIDFLYTAVALRATYVEAYYNLGTSAFQVMRCTNACFVPLVELRLRLVAFSKQSRPCLRLSFWCQSTLGPTLIWGLLCACLLIDAVLVLLFDFQYRYSMRDYAAAVDVFERLLEFQPDNLGHYTNLGRFLQHSAVTLHLFPCLFSHLQLSRDARRLCRGRARLHARSAKQSF